MTVKGKGTNLPDGVLPLAVPVTVQVQGTNGSCWTARFVQARASDAGQFEAKSE